MYKTAFIFPGQGSQCEGMGKKLLNKYFFAKKYFEEAEDICNINLCKLCCYGTANELQGTEVSQPAIFLVSYLLYLAYCEENNETPIFYAGHSLGEYTALLASGILDFGTAMGLISKRAQYMSEAARKTKGTMLAVTCDNQAKELLALLRKRKEMADEQLYIGCINSSTQYVLSGSTESIEKIACDITEKNCGKVIPLKVSGAFHSALMKEAAEKFEHDLQNTVFCKIPISSSVISNVTGEPYNSWDEIKRCLKLQLTHPVHWLDSVKYMKERGADTFIEFGVTTTLSSIIRREVTGNVFLYNG